MTTRDSDRDPRPHRTSPSCGGRGRRARRHAAGERRRERKERVLHTRISDQLAEDIRQLADDLRVPASNLVRNVLEEVFTMVDTVTDDMGDLMDELIDEAEDVRDRVRGQRRRRSRRRGPGHRARRADARGASDADVEAELREDEAREARAARPSARAARAEAGAAEAPSSGATSDGSSPAASDAAGPEDTRSTAERFPDVLGWQPLVLNRDGVCGRCRRPLRAGESAFLGMAAGGLTETALCGRCVSSGSGRGSA